MKTSKHSLSRYHITAMDAGALFPIGCREVLPGDTFQHAIQAMIRLQPMVAPTMHPIHAEIHHFYIPNRLVMDDWEDFITGGSDGNDNTVLPYIIQSNVGGGSSTYPNYYSAIANYLGVQEPDTGKPIRINALPIRAAQLVFNEYFRDQDLVPEVAISTADGTSGADTITNTQVQRVAWSKDYLTTARPFAAKGPSVQIPVEGTPSKVRIQHDASVSPQVDLSVFSTAASSYTKLGADTPFLRSAGTGSTEPFSLYADLSALGINPEDLRTGMAWYKWEEMRARYGSRYTEYLRAAFGVVSSDARLQRPEYLGGGSQTIQMSEVLQTSNPGTPTDPEDATGALKGHGIGSVKSNAYRRFFEEHGYVISFMTIRPINIYRDGMDTHWLKTSKFDYYQREFEALGSQGIKKGEVYSQGVHSTDQETWGYQDRYYDYRRSRSYVSGTMRNTLSPWTEARMFTSYPALNSDFVVCTPSDRIFAAPIDQNYMVMIYDKCVARRPVAKIGMSSNFRS